MTRSSAVGYRRMGIAIVIAYAMLAASCSDTPTTPTAATTTAVTDSFSSVLNVGGTATRTFIVAARGTVQATLAATSSPNVQVGLMVGIPRVNGTGCVPNVSVTTEASPTPQISVAADPGSFCVQVYDIGTLKDPMSFTVSIAHP